MTIQELSQKTSESTRISEKDILTILVTAFKQLGNDRTIVIPNNTEILTYQIYQQ